MVHRGMTSETPAFLGPLTRNLQTPSVDFCRLTWQNVTLNEPSAESTEVDVSHRELSQILWQILPQLDLVDCAYLFKNLREAQLLTQKDQLREFFAFYEYQWNSRLAQLCEKLVATPLLFKDWVRRRKASPKDLHPLLSLEDMDDFSPSLERIAEFNPSRSQGKQVLDLLVDLELSHNNGPWHSETLELWLSEVYQKRYPLTQQRDAKSSLGQGLPQFAEYRKKRVGDRLLHHLSFSFVDKNEALQKLQRLEKNMGDPS